MLHVHCRKKDQEKNEKSIENKNKVYSEANI